MGRGDGLAVVGDDQWCSNGRAKGPATTGGQQQASVVYSSGFGLVMVDQNRESKNRVGGEGW